MARSNLQIKVGTYTGDGTDSRNITGVGFRPDLVIVKSSSAVAAVFRTTTMRGDSTMYLGSNTTSLSDAIQEILSDGFQVGTNAVVNGNGNTYYYIAVKGYSAQSYFTVGNYIGNASDNRNLTTAGITFTPDFVGIKKDGSDNPLGRISSQNGDTSFHFSGVADASNEIQNLQSNGFQLGTSTRSNGNGSEYHFFAFKVLSGVVAVGTYTGTGAALSITGLGFKPDIVISKNGSLTTAATLKTASMTTTASFQLDSATAATGITSLDTDGFSVGTGTGANGNGNTMWWIALKSGNFNVPITRTAA